MVKGRRIGRTHRMLEQVQDAVWKMKAVAVIARDFCHANTLANNFLNNYCEYLSLDKQFSSPYPRLDFKCLGSVMFVPCGALGVDLATESIHGFNGLVFVDHSVWEIA